MRPMGGPPIRFFKGEDGQWISVDESSPSSHFHHIYASVCSRMQPVCTFCPKSKSQWRVGLRAHAKSRMHFMHLFWELGSFRPFPFKGSAYGAYGCIRMTMKSGLSSTACRHWGASCPSESKVHTAVHTAFRPKTPYRPPIDGISQIGIFVLSWPGFRSDGRIWPHTAFLGPSGGLPPGRPPELVPGKALVRPRRDA